MVGSASLHLDRELGILKTAQLVALVMSSFLGSALKIVVPSCFAAGAGLELFLIKGGFCE